MVMSSVVLNFQLNTERELRTSVHLTCHNHKEDFIIYIVRITKTHLPKMSSIFYDKSVKH